MRGRVLRPLNHCSLVSSAVSKLVLLVLAQGLLSVSPAKLLLPEITPLFITRRRFSVKVPGVVKICKTPHVTSFANFAFHDQLKFLAY